MRRKRKKPMRKRDDKWNPGFFHFSPSRCIITSRSSVCRMERPRFVWWGFSRASYNRMRIIGIDSLLLWNTPWEHHRKERFSPPPRPPLRSPNEKPQKKNGKRKKWKKFVVVVRDWRFHGVNCCILGIVRAMLGVHVVGVAVVEQVVVVLVARI